MDKAIEILEKRLRQAEDNAQRWYNKDDKDMFDWYSARALELEYALKDLRENQAA